MSGFSSSFFGKKPKRVEEKKSTSKATSRGEDAVGEFELTPEEEAEFAKLEAETREKHDDLSPEEKAALDAELESLMTEDSHEAFKSKGDKEVQLTPEEEAEFAKLEAEVEAEIDGHDKDDGFGSLSPEDAAILAEFEDNLEEAQRRSDRVSEMFADRSRDESLDAELRELESMLSKENAGKAASKAGAVGSLSPASTPKVEGAAKPPKRTR